MAVLQINVSGELTPPSVSNNQAYLNVQTKAFDLTSFTKDFTDPIGGVYSVVTLVSLPTEGVLTYLGSPVFIGTEIPVADAANFVFTIDDKYAIYNDELYKFTDSIDTIVANYVTAGYQLIANTNGLLTFVNPLNLTDIVYVQGQELENSTVSFEYRVSSTLNAELSNVATFSLIPWENVNLKQNYYDFGGSDGDNAYEVALLDGFVGTRTEWLITLIGAQGPPGDPGIAGADGSNGTSVVILGSKATVGDLPPSGDAIGDGYLVNGYLHVWDGTNWINVGLIQGPKGLDGKNLEYNWNGTQLGIRVEGAINYIYSDLKGIKGDKGDKGDIGVGLKGDAGDPGIQGIPGVDGDDGGIGLTGTEGSSAYQVWLNAGNTGTIAQYLLAIKGGKGDAGADGADASFTHNEFSIDWLTGDSQIFTVDDSTTITDIYVDGKRLEKKNPDGSTDEWEIYSSTQVRIIPLLENNDRITFIESVKYVSAQDRLYVDDQDTITLQSAKDYATAADNDLALQIDATEEDILALEASKEPLNVPPIANTKVKVYNLDGSVSYKDYDAPFEVVEEYSRSMYFPALGEKGKLYITTEDKEFFYFDEISGLFEQLNFVPREFDRYPTVNDFPAIGVDTTIYFDLTDKKLYLWVVDAYELFGGGGGSTIAPPESWVYVGGEPQTFTVPFDIVEVNSLHVGNLSLVPTQYTISGATVTITDTLSHGAVIHFRYWKSVTANAVSYTKAESDVLLANKLDKTAEIQSFVSLTQAAYDAITTKSTTTIYFIE